MKNIKNVLFLIVCMMGASSMSLLAQCPGATDVCGNTPVSFPASSPSSANCSEIGNCSGQPTEYLVVSNPDTVIVGSATSNSFVPSDYSGCVNLLPICYDLGAVQTLVDAMNNNTTCCDLLNSFDPNAPGACDSITSVFSAGSQVQNLADVLSIVDRFTDTLTYDGFLTVVNTINDNAGILFFACSGSGAIGYCVDPINFGLNSYEVVGAPLDLVLTGTNSGSDEAASNSITSTETVTGNTSYTAGAEILLDAGFSVELPAEFDGVIGVVAGCP